MEQESIIKPTTDRYGSLWFNFTSIEDFDSIRSSLNGSVITHKHALWITTSLGAGIYEKQFKQLGFEYHHCEKEKKTDNNIMFWLCKNGFDIPCFGSCNIGAGGIVIRTKNDREEVLITIPNDRKETGYEVPGGGVNIGELPSDGAIREVKEETGIDATIDYLIGTVARTKAYRGLLNNIHLYYIMKLAPNCTGDDINQQNTEVSNTKWVSITSLLYDIKHGGGSKVRFEVACMIRKFCGKESRSYIKIQDDRSDDPNHTMEIQLFEKPNDRETQQ